MCGIFAIFNNNYKKNLSELFNNLQNLQHRGKDGYGIAYIDIANSLISIKDKGELNNKKQISVKLHRIYKNYLEFYERPFQVKFLRKFSYLESGKIDVKKMMGKN